MSTWSLEQHCAVAVLTFRRPPKNMIDFAAAAELADLLELLAQRSDVVSVVLLIGGIDNYFIAHADIRDLARIGRGELSGDSVAGFGRVLTLLEDMPQPTVAAIDGQAWGGGSEIALACSLRVGSARANVAQPEVRVGLIPGAGGTQRLQRLIGKAAAYDVILRARIVQADEALRLGWLTEVLPSEDFRQAAINWAQVIARNPPEALFAAKKALGLADQVPPEEHLRQERELFRNLLSTSAAFQVRAAGGARRISVATELASPATTAAIEPRSARDQPRRAEVDGRLSAPACQGWRRCVSPG